MPKCLSLVLLLAAGCPLAAQSVSELAPASRVRVTGALEAHLPARLLDGAVAVGEPVERDGILRVRVGEELLSMPRPGKHLDGTVLAQDADTLTIKSGKFAEPLRIPRQALSKIEFSRGRDSRGKGALIGMGIGFALGFVLGTPCGPGHDDRWVDFCGPTFGAVAGGVLAIPGGLLGLALPPSERWEQVATARSERPRVAVVPRRDGLGLSVSIGF